MAEIILSQMEHHLVFHFSHKRRQILQWTSIKPIDLGPHLQKKFHERDITDTKTYNPYFFVSDKVFECTKILFHIYFLVFLFASCFSDKSRSF